jgi:hypothetical protein
MMAELVSFPTDGLPTSRPPYEESFVGLGPLFFEMEDTWVLVGELLKSILLTSPPSYSLI